MKARFEEGCPQCGETHDGSVTWPCKRRREAFARNDGYTKICPGCDRRWHGVPSRMGFIDIERCRSCVTVVKKSQERARAPWALMGPGRRPVFN